MRSGRQGDDIEVVHGYIGHLDALARHIREKRGAM